MSAVIRAIAAALMTKICLVSRMKTIVNALPMRLPGKTAQAAQQGILNVLLADRAFQHRPRFRLFARPAERLPLHNLPHWWCDGDGRAVRVPVRSLDHRSLKASPGQGP